MQDKSRIIQLLPWRTLESKSILECSILELVKANVLRLTDELHYDCWDLVRQFADNLGNREHAEKHFGLLQQGTESHFPFPRIEVIRGDSKK